MASIRCDQCQLAVINGIVCHETGCPNTGKLWDHSTQAWVSADEEEEEVFYPEGPGE